MHNWRGGCNWLKVCHSPKCQSSSDCSLLLQCRIKLTFHTRQQWSWQLKSLAILSLEIDHESIIQSLRGKCLCVEIVSTILWLRNPTKNIHTVTTDHASAIPPPHSCVAYKKGWQTDRDAVTSLPESFHCAPLCFRNNSFKPHFLSLATFWALPNTFPGLPISS